MKWILIVLGSLVGLLVLGVVTLLAMGTSKDANRMTNSIVIHQKPETVWPWLYKPDKVKQWVTWLVDIREEGSGEPMVGGKAIWIMEDRNNGNQRMEITGTVKAIEPGLHIEIALSAPEGFRAVLQIPRTILMIGVWLRASTCNRPIRPEQFDIRRHLVKFLREKTRAASYAVGAI